jgi:hypothetical protein
VTAKPQTYAPLENSESSRRAASGHYEYKSWTVNAKGERIARKFYGKDARKNADLASNCYRNSNGLETAFGIVFDLDAHRAKDCWIDADGKLDWSLIFPAIEKEIPEVAKLICHAVRSTGGKGLGLIMAINPMPVTVSTEPNQKSALKLQGRLLAVFENMGLGADFGARGVCRDLPNFNNPDKIVYLNNSPRRELESSGRPVITELHKLLNARDRAARVAERIYNDERVEKGLARLVLWLLGAVRFDKFWKFEGQSYDQTFKHVPYLSGWSVSAKLTELCALTGLSDAFLRKYLKNPPKWLKATHHEGEGWSLSVPLSKEVPWLQERSLYLLQKTQDLTGKVSFDPNEICLPWWVQDGERNAWIVRLALIYKWAGYSMESTIEKVLLRIQAIPGAETSRNCKQMRAIVRSLYRRTPDTLGALDWKALPDWIQNDKIFCSLLVRTTPRRGKTPTPELQPWMNTAPTTGVSASVTISNQAPAFNPETLSELQKSTAETKLTVVRRKQRIGVFHDEKMILCVTKKHYKAANMIAYLERKWPELAKKKLRLHSPRRSQQEAYFSKVDAAEFALPSWQVCGRKKTLNESIGDWREKKGIVFKDSKMDKECVEMEIPF